MLYATSHISHPTRKAWKRRKPPLIFNWETSGGQAGPTSEGTWHPERRENEEEAPPKPMAMKKSCHLRLVLFFQITLITYNQIRLNHYRWQLATKCLDCYEKYHFSVLVRVRERRLPGEWRWALISGLALIYISFSHRREAEDPHRLGISFQLA